MPALEDFRTVPDELLHVAVDAATFFEEQGFTVSIERRDLGFPSLPTFVAEIGHERHIIEVCSAPDLEKIDRWIRFSQSQAGDTRFHLVVRQVPDVSPEALRVAIEKRLGLLHHNDEELVELRQAPDLAIHVNLPETKTLPSRLKPLLSGPFKKIRDGDWRDGLEGAYGEVEQLAREYLRKGIKAGTVQSVTGPKKKKRFLEAEEVDGLTLGQLRVAFSQIQKKNQKDSLIEATIEMINQSRIQLAHKRKRKDAEENLRKVIGQNMYAVISCLEELTAH